VYFWVTLNAKMSSFGMDARIETFAKLIKFMTSMNWSSAWQRSGMARDKMSSTTQWVSGENVSGRVFMTKEGIASIQYDSRAHVLCLEANPWYCVKYVNRYLLLILCISQGIVWRIYKVRWEIWLNLVANLLLSPTVKELLQELTYQ